MLRDGPALDGFLVDKNMGRMKNRAQRAAAIEELGLQRERRISNPGYGLIDAAVLAGLKHVFVFGFDVAERHGPFRVGEPVVPIDTVIDQRKFKGSLAETEIVGEKHDSTRIAVVKMQ